MEAPETPLVLLSHAAAFVNRDVSTCVGDYEDPKKSPLNSETLATKSHKKKRANERSNLSFPTGPAKALKRPSKLQSSAITISDTEAEEIADDKDSQHTKRQGPSLYSRQIYDPCHCAGNTMDDKPLDMSKKCAVIEQQRPSVITCASTLLRKTRERKVSEETHSATTSESKNEKRTRREVVSGMCDPVIDEHFRRSLGKDYTEIFSAPGTATSVSITVDDHFAKALGETWQRLQEKQTLATPASSQPPTIKETDKSAKLGSSSSLVQRGLVTL